MVTHTRKKPTTTKRIPAKAVVPGRKKVKTRSTGAPVPRVEEIERHRMAKTPKQNLKHTHTLTLYPTNWIENRKG
jgi:hypothetical protein